MVSGNGSEHASQVSMRFNFVQLTGLDNRLEHSPVLRTSIIAREERGFTVQRDGAHATFEGVVVNLNATIGQEQV